MTDKKDVKAQSVDEMDALVGQGDMDAKRELAIRMMEGNGVPQNHPKAVALLEDCVALGDAEAMLILANCCAFGHGMEHDAERAESLISEAANKGNEEALCLMDLVNRYKGDDGIDLTSLLEYKKKRSLHSPLKIPITGQIFELSGASIRLFMNLVPCKALILLSLVSHTLFPQRKKMHCFHHFVLNCVNRQRN